MSTDTTYRLTIDDHRGALAIGEQPTCRTVEVPGLRPAVARDLAAVLLDLPPAWPAPDLGTHHTAHAGGRRIVTLEREQPPAD